MSDHYRDNGFHYDDTHSIVENPDLRRLANIPSFFIDPSTFSREENMAMYRPLLQSSFALNYALGGLNIWGYHEPNAPARAGDRGIAYQRAKMLRYSREAEAEGRIYLPAVDFAQ